MAGAARDGVIVVIVGGGGKAEVERSSSSASGIVVIIEVVRSREEVDRNFLKSEFVFDDDDVNSKLKTF